MTGKPIKTNLEQARRLFLRRQLLINPEIPGDKAGILHTIEKLGYIQIDTINVIERSHHLVIFTRCPDYKKENLHELQAKDKKIFEYWAHAASFIPMKDYRFYLRAIEKKPKKDSWLGKWIGENRKLIKKVKERIIKDGALTASDFGNVADRKRGTWWDWKPAKMALEVLFWQGVLMIKERQNFQRVYDLTERVLPKNIDSTKPTLEEEKRFFIIRALKAMGAATVKDINSYIGVSGKLNEWIEYLHESKKIQKIEIEDLKKTYYILNEDAAEFERGVMETDSKVYLLSPFDNSIILRDRTKDLFGFNYSLECYVPKRQRKYGYFCLPILWHNQLVGRIDPKANRQNKIFFINNIHLEDKKLDYIQFMPALAQTLNDFCRFHDCEKVALNKNIPAKIRRYILKYL